MTVLTLEEFRQCYPVFTVKDFPDAAVNHRLRLGEKFFAGNRWRDMDLRKHAIGLYTAHYLECWGSTNSGGSTRDSAKLGVVTSKSVDGASVSYDSSSSANNSAGFWNLTIYGRELWSIMGIVGSGAVQL